MTMLLSGAQRRQLDAEGYVQFPGVLVTEQVEALLTHLETLWEIEGAAASQENYIENNTRRLANLANKGDVFRGIFAHSLILDAVGTVIGPDIRLSMLNARDALPGEGTRQSFHCDTDNSGKPDEQGYYACTAIWCLDDFTAENGATRLIPGTHRSGRVPKEVLTDISAPHPDEICLTGKRGDVIVFNGHTWHAGGANQSQGPRRAILAHYFRAGILRSENRRQHLTPEVLAQLTPSELAIIGPDEP